MKKIIIQIYHILQVLWSSKVKFVSLSQLLGCPLFVSSFGLFRVPGFIVLLVGIEKKEEEEGRKKRCTGKERKKVLKERKNNNKELLKKQTNKQKQACRPSQFCWSFLAIANSGSLAQLFSIPTSTQAALHPALLQPLDP